MNNAHENADVPQRPAIPDRSWQRRGGHAHLTTASNAANDLSVREREAQLEGLLERLRRRARAADTCVADAQTCTRAANFDRELKQLREHDRS